MTDGSSDSLTLTWKNVTAWTKITKKSEKRKKILTEIDGIAESGVLTAILSPSGAGKTTLLAVLSQRYKGPVNGEILINGCEFSNEEMALISGYVCQKESNFEALTVYEHLNFVARLKMGKNTTKECRHRNVLKVTQSLILSHKLNVSISSLSGGQKKRLTLAAQLLTEPKILFVDEPTTGLDSYNAERVVKLLRKIANSGKMVLCAIHQPASGIFELFDDVTLLASGGKLAYHGPVSSMYSFLSELGVTCPENYNISEFVISQVTVKYSVSVEEYKKKDEELEVQRIVDYFRQSQQCENLMVDIENVKNQTTALRIFTNMQNREPVSFTTEFGWLLWRTAILNKYSIRTTILKFCINGFLCFGFGFFYRYAFIEEHTMVQNISGYLYLYSLQLCNPTLWLVTQEIPRDIPVCVTEVADRLYSPISYYLSRTMFMTLLMVVQTIFFTLLCYLGSGLKETVLDFFMIIFITMLMITVICAYGTFASTAFPSSETSALFTVPFEFISRVFCGFSIRVTSLPWYLSIFRFISHYYYTFEAMNIIQWRKSVHIVCDFNDDIPCYHSGQEVLSSFGFKQEHLIVDIIGLLAGACIWHTLAFLFLIRRLEFFAAY